MDYSRNKSITPLLGIVAIIIISIISFSYAFETNVSAACTDIFVQDSGDVNIVFLPDNYETVLEFRSDVSFYIDRNGRHNGLLSVEPFKSNWYKFNFRAVDELQNFDCLTGKDYLLCNQNRVKSVASACPHDYIIVLSKRRVFSEEAYLRSSSYLDVTTLNTADNRLVFAHEFGHLFADLADEYVTGEATVNAINCDVITCPKWIGKFDDVGCFQGCTLISMYRSTQNSIMRDYTQTNEFGSVNEDALKRRLL